MIINSKYLSPETKQKIIVNTLILEKVTKRKKK